jgi:hypothetical protein
MPNLSFAYEPAVWVGVINAVVVLAIAFGAPITVEQKGAISAVVVAVSGIFLRSQVTPVAKIQDVPLAAAALERAEEAPEQ